MSLRIPEALRNASQLSTIPENPLRSGLKHPFFTGCSHFKDFFWAHRYIAFPLLGIALATIYFARRHFSAKSAITDPNPPKVYKVYNPTTPAPAAQLYSQGPLFKIVDASVVLQLQKVLQNTNPKHIPMSLHQVHEEGFLPTHMLQMDNIIYYCSSPFMFGQRQGKDGRIAVLALCVVDGKAYPRLFYFSQSQSLWRVLPQVVKVDPNDNPWEDHPQVVQPNNSENRILGHFGKGMDEVDTILPLELNMALSTAFLYQQCTFPRLEDKVKIPNIVDTAPGSGMYPAFCSPEYRNLMQKIENPKLDISNEQLKFTQLPLENSPNFSRLLKTFDFWSPLYGHMRGYIYPSHNSVCRFLFCEVIDSSSSTILGKMDRYSVSGNFHSICGKAYLAAIEVVHENPMTIFGNREFYFHTKNNDLPLLEYPKQIPGGFDVIKESPRIHPYACAWNVVRENALVQEWYKTQLKDLPPAY